MKPQSQRLKAVHARAMSRFDVIFSAVQDERQQCLEDRRFYSVVGAQWEGGLGEQFENKPMFEMNKVHLAVIRVVNEYRNNRITVDFTSKDGSDNDKLADACDGLYRADEQDSGAQEAYDNAFEEAAAGGFGAWRLRARYEDDDDEDDTRQRIDMEPIHDADSCVFFDMDCKRQDKRNAKFCFVLNGMTREGYKDEYGDDPTSWDRGINQTEFDWSTSDLVYVAEYYEVEEFTEVIHVFRGLALNEDEPDELKVSEKELEDDEDRRATLEATGFREVRQKRVTRKRVHKYVLSGGCVLKDEGVIAGRRIPIIPVFGKRWFVDGTERLMGHVRLAKDAQRLKNMLVSRLAEIASKSPVSKPIFTPEQMAGHSSMWSNDNVQDFPYLLVNPILDKDGNQMPAGAVGYTKAPEIPQALAALLAITEQDLQDLLGNQQAGEQLQPNMSGKAVELVQNRLDMQVFIYMDNMKKAVQTSGEVWLSMAKDILVEEKRKMKTVGKDGQTGSVELMKPGYDKETGKVTSENDLTEAKFDVVTDVGPSSSSRRAATVRAITGLLQMTTDPESMKILGAIAMANMEGEGLSEAREYYRKQLVRMGVYDATEQDKEELAAEQANAKPDPQALFLQAAAEEKAANATKVQSDIAYNQARTDKAQAEAVEIMADIDLAQSQHIMESIAMLDGMNAPAAPQQPVQPTAPPQGINQ